MKSDDNGRKIAEIESELETIRHKLVEGAMRLHELQIRAENAARLKGRCARATGAGRRRWNWP